MMYYKKHFYYNLTDERAVPPTKAKTSDTGYDVTIISEHKQFGNVVLYDTGIRLMPGSPDIAFYLAPRSSIIKSGYIMANSIGIIDHTYTGNLMVALMKIDESAPDLELPCRIAQLIPMQPISLNWMEMSNEEFELANQQMQELDNQHRGNAGFGSTGK